MHTAEKCTSHTTQSQIPSPKDTWDPGACCIIISPLVKTNAAIETFAHAIKLHLTILKKSYCIINYYNKLHKL